MAERKPGQRGKRKKCIPRKAEKWIRQYEKQRDLHRKIREAGGEILKSRNFDKSKDFLQHGSMSVKTHSINVAKYSLAISEKLRLSCNREEMIRGALLHDYFQYDWHKTKDKKPWKLHGFTHPKLALQNASREYRLSSRERDIIRKHMWPLTIVPPVYKEAWVVSAADKWCSLMETIGLHKGG
ncbi:MAG: HDIG domain-containing protein [Clostridium sp.]|jgi:uncharacterized protein|nr:HDIG domain-containing protein [Clostridium sp.]